MSFGLRKVKKVAGGKAGSTMKGNRFKFFVSVVVGGGGYAYRFLKMYQFGISFASHNIKT